jgi:D-3-phosphoglycerate dehydrogenase
MDADFLAGADKLKWIARSGVGMENIDEAYCASKGIQAFNAAGGNADAVGEHVIGMLLALFNKLASGNEEVRAGIWRREAHRGLELGHRTLGIIGFGHTGQSLAKKLSGFGTRVLAYDKYVPVEMKGVQSASLKEIQQTCDVISFHVPLTEETRHYLDEAFIQDMEKPFYLVNAARGPVASTEAMVKGLEYKKILGACLDVLEEEDASLSLKGMDGPAFQKLITHKNVHLSPHVAGWTVESYVRLAEVLLERIQEADQL